MKKTLIIILIYAFVIVPILGGIAANIDNVRLGSPGNLIRFAVLVMLVHLGMTIQNKAAKRRYLHYLSAIVGTTLIFFAISVVFDIGLENLWLNVATGVFVGALIIVMLFDLSKILKDANEKASRALYAAACIGVVVVVMAVVFALAEVFSFWFVQ